MIYDIEISDQAEIDLRGIFEYIAFELQAPENASGQLDRLEACIMDLDHMPKRYRQYELEESSNTLLLNCRHQKMQVVSLIGLKHVLWILIICRRDIDNMNWNHGKV